jgi:hypothetical protein
MALAKMASGGIDPHLPGRTGIVQRASRCNARGAHGAWPMVDEGLKAVCLPRMKGVAL